MRETPAHKAFRVQTEPRHEHFLGQRLGIRRPLREDVAVEKFALMARSDDQLALLFGDDEIHDHFSGRPSTRLAMMFS